VTDKNKLTTDITTIGYWTPAAEFALRQSEECFCDFLGVRLFGESFLHSFEYLIAPNIGHPRHVFYPPLPRRAQYMARCAAATGAGVPTDFASHFFEVPSKLSRADEAFLVTASDWATEDSIPELIKAAKDFADNAGIARYNAQNCDRAYENFKEGYPASGDVTFVDIINAAWRVYLEPHIWPGDGVPASRKFEIISEIALKSIEVMEYNIRMEEAKSAN
jgi:hypothetical protein